MEERKTTSVTIAAVLLIVGLIVGFGVGYWVAPGKVVYRTPEKPFLGEKLVVGTWSGPWEGYWTDAFVIPFETETGAEIEVIPHWGYMPEILAAKEAGAPPPLDCTIVTYDDLINGVENDVLLPIRWENVPNIDEVWPYLRDLIADEYKDYGVPEDVGALALTYRKDLIDFTPTSYDDLWREELDGLISLEDTGWSPPAIYLGAILSDYATGADEIYTDEGVEALFEELVDLSSHLKFWYQSGADFYAALDAGEVVFGQYWHGTALSRAYDDERLEVILPELTVAYYDLYSVVKGTAHRDLAEAFINYITSAEAQSRFLALHGNFMSNMNVELPTETRPDIAALQPTSTEDWEKILIIDSEYFAPRTDDWYERLKKDVFPLAG